MSISVIHQHSGLENPTRGAVARVAMRKIKRTPAPRRTQAYGVSRPMLEAMLRPTGAHEPHDRGPGVPR